MMHELEKKEVVLKASGWSNLQLPRGPESFKYGITGDESQIVTIALDANDTVKGEPGVMMYLTPGVTQRATCEGCCARCLSGEDCFVMNFTNSGRASNVAYAALTPNDPMAKVVPVDLSAPEVGGTLIAQKGAFMASYGNVNIGISLDCNCCRCCCGGLGLVRQKIEGDGILFIGATGTIVQKVLQENEVIIVDTNCILAFSESCKLDLKRAGGLLGIVGGGEGIFNTTLTGPGLVIVQSMNKQMFLDALAADKIYRR